MNNSRESLKAGFWYTITNFTMSAIGFLLTPVFTRFMTHDEFGLFNDYIAWIGIFTICFTLYLESTFISARYDFSGAFDDYAGSVLVLTSTIVCFFCGIVNIFFLQIQPIIRMNRKNMNYLFLYILFLPAISMYTQKERFLFRYKKSIIIGVLVSISTTVTSVFLVLCLQEKLEARIIGYIFPTVIIGMVVYTALIKRTRHIRLHYWHYALKICIPFIPHLLSLRILDLSDKLMITRICGADDNALYSLAYSCGTIVVIMTGSLNSAFSPWLGNKLHEQGYSDINRFSRKYILLYCVLALFLMLFAPDLLLIMGGESYMQAVYLLPPIICGCIFQFIYTMFVNVEQFSKKTVGMALASVSAAILNIALNLLLIPHFGFVAAAYTTLVSYLWLLIVHMWLVKRIGLSNVYSYKFIFVIIIIAFGVTCVVNFVYELWIVRYLLIMAFLLVIVIGAVLKREIVRSFLNVLLKKS